MSLGADASWRIFSGGNVSIMTRGGMTGKFAAAASGKKDEAYQPVQSAQSSMLSALTGGRPQNGHPPVAMDERTGPSRVQKQNYSAVPPPAALVEQDATPSYRGRGRGARGGIGAPRGRGQPRGRGGPFRGRGHALGQHNGTQEPSS